MHLTGSDLLLRSISTHREWLETDGLGGYASASISAANTRRYHGLLCVPLAELGERHVLVSKLMPTLTLPSGERFELDCNLFAGGSLFGGPAVAPEGDQLLERFWISEAPCWEYRCGHALLQITVLMPRGIAATLVEYRLSGVATATLQISPLIAARNIHRTAHTNSSINQSPVWNELNSSLVVKPYIGYPSFEIVAPSRSHWVSTPTWWNNFYLPRDAERGFDAGEDLHCPGSFTLELQENQGSIFACYAPHTKPVANHNETFANELSRRRKAYGNGEMLPILRRAAEQFLTFDAQKNAGVVAGYPWFDRWGRDTLISLNPLTNILGDSGFERNVIEHQLSLVHDGLIPNLITEDGTALYNSIDAVLLLFVATYRHFQRTQDSAWIAKTALPQLKAAANALQRGTKFGIFVGSDGLLCAGMGDVQLTWMDAKVNGHPVTPRHGKAVEINALWYNAMRIIAELEPSSSSALSARALATQIQRSFVQGFVKADGSLRDVLGSDVLGDGGEVRPNQVFAGCLPFPILHVSQTKLMLERVRSELLTPRGLRTLAPSHRDYRPRYSGDPHTRDSVYHQGTVWPWLLGPYAESLIHCGELDELERIKDAFKAMLYEGCLGSIAEVYDAQEPQFAGGCFAQAWSVAAACSVFLK